MPRSYEQVLKDFFSLILRPQVRQLDLSGALWLRIETDISLRLQSALAAWPDIEFRRAVLLLGAENAVGFHPRSVPADIHALVAVAIRNSIIEEIHATRPFDPSFGQTTGRLSDKGMERITRLSATYFADEFKSGVCFVPTPVDDIFRTLAFYHPAAWHRISLIANSALQEEFPSEADIHPMVASPSPDSYSHSGADVISGFDPSIGTALEGAIQYAISTPRVFASDSFKMLSRNPAKLLAVIDRLVRSDCTFVTNNYAFGPSYCAKRTHLRAPAHYYRSSGQAFFPDVTVASRHRKLLERANAGR